MKALFISIVMIVSVAVSAQDKNDNVKTVEFTVNGICGMCKDRIENAAQIKGVKFAEWDKASKVLKVVYRTDKTTEQKIHNSIAKAGHDTELVQASDEDYSKLHACCKYRKSDATGQSCH